MHVCEWTGFRVLTFLCSFTVCNYFPFSKSFSFFKAPRGSELLTWHPSWARNQYLCSPSNWQYVLHYIHIIDSLYIFSHHTVGLDLSHLSIPRPNSGNTVQNMFAGPQLRGLRGWVRCGQVTNASLSLASALPHMLSSAWGQYLHLPTLRRAANCLTFSKPQFRCCFLQEPFPKLQNWGGEAFLWPPLSIWSLVAYLLLALQLTLYLS